jgi:hypothetical protein
MLANATNWTKRALVVSMVALMTMGYGACSEEDGANGSLNSSAAGPSLIASPGELKDPFPEPEPEVTGEVFRYSDPATKQFIDSTATTDWFAAEMQHCVALGYEYTPEQSFILEGDSGDYHYWSVSYALRYTPDTTIGMGMIRQSRITDTSGVIAAPLEVIEVRFINPLDTTYEYIENNTWYKSSPPTSIVPLNWAWGDWWKCTVAGTTGGCAAAAVGCAFTGPGWAVCTAIGCAASAVGSAVGCAVAQFWD